MTETAQGTALAIDRSAREAGEANRRDALAAGYRVVQVIKGLEGELNALTRMVGSEADGLRAKLDRSRLLSASASRSAVQGMLEGHAITEERDSLGIAPAPESEVAEQPAAESEMPQEPAVEDPPALLEVEEDQPVAEEEVEEGPLESPDAVGEQRSVESEMPQEPAVEDPPALLEVEEDQPVAEEEVEEGPLESPDTVGEQGTVESETPQKPGVDDQSAFLEAGEGESEEGESEEGESEEGESEEGESEEGLVDPPDAPFGRLTSEHGEGTASQAREDPHALVVGTSDLELAELYSRAKSHAGAGGDEHEASYWTALARATVDEALSRPDFGERTAESLSGGRKAKKRRAKVLQPLLAARDGASGGEPESVTAPAPQSAEIIASVGESETETDIEPQDAEIEVELEDPDTAIEPKDPDTDVGPQDSDSEVEPRDSDVGSVKGEGRWSPLRKLGRRERSFIDVAGECAVCRRPFQAESSEALLDSGWLVKGRVGLCPDDQAQGWQLAEGSHLPYQLGSAD